MTTEPVKPIPSARRAGASVLLVEDEPQLREDLRVYLSSQGFRVFVAGGAEEALSLWASSAHRLDLLVADVRLPGLTGVDLWHHLTAARPDLPVLLVSGHSERELMDCGAIEEGLPFLQKPFRAETLVARMRSLLPQT